MMPLQLGPHAARRDCSCCPSSGEYGMLNDGTPNLHDTPTAPLNPARDRAAPYRDVLDHLRLARPDTSHKPTPEAALPSVTHPGHFLFQAVDMLSQGQSLLDVVEKHGRV